MTTDELRAKFEVWAAGNFLDLTWVDSKPPMICEPHYQDNRTMQLWLSWQAAHASQDAEVEALIRKYEKRSMYEDGGLYSNIIDDLQELLGK